MPKKTLLIALFALLAAGFALWALSSRSRTGEGGAETHDASPRPTKPLIVNLSLPRTGTVSITSIYSPLGSAHEFMRAETIQHLYDWDEGVLSDAQLDEFLVERVAALDQSLDATLGPKHRINVDSATFLYNVQDRLFALFPDAKYLLCVRDGESWLVSFVGMMIFITTSNHEVLQPREKYENAMKKSFSAQFSFDIFSDPETLGAKIEPLLPVMAEFWGKWTLETLAKMKGLPPERRLVLETQDISNSLDALAALAAVPVTELESSRTHLNKDRGQHDIKSLIGADKIHKAFAPWQAKVDAAMKAYREP